MTTWEGSQEPNQHWESSNLHSHPRKIIPGNPEQQNAHRSFLSCMWERVKHWDKVMESHPWRCPRKAWMRHSVLWAGDKVGTGHSLDGMALEGFSNFSNSMILQFQPRGTRPLEQPQPGNTSTGKGGLSSLWNPDFSKEKLESCRKDSFLGRIPSSSSSPSLISHEATLQLSLESIKPFQV